ncbi:glycoside hydrolase family 45 protein [Infundibulicybe gibba]|nr:glycoside hydrolase family 45 protein [Infundibulicybe gibba]
MKLVFISSLLFTATAIGALVLDERATGGYIQHATGSASFTKYADCSEAACGQIASGYTAAINTLSYGAPTGQGAGDACGRCFAITGKSDPYTPGYKGPFKSIVVKVTDLWHVPPIRGCLLGQRLKFSLPSPMEVNMEWCGQTRSDPKNKFNQPFHIDICEDTGGAAAFFPAGHDALTGTFKEVPCSQWSGSNGKKLWEGSCLKAERADWPAVGCGNKGTLLEVDANFHIRRKTTGFSFGQI